MIIYIFTNNVEHSHLRSGLLVTDISDHFPIFCISSDNTRIQNSEEVIFVHDKSQRNILSFLEKFKQIDWHRLDGYNDPNTCYSSFLKKYIHVFESCCPLRKVNRKHRRNKPWISKGLFKSIHKKNRLYKQYLSDPSSINEAKYKKFKNKLNHSLRIAKRLYYDRTFIESKSNMRATWRLLDEVVTRKKLRTRPNSVFRIDDQEISDPSEIANRFCHYFSNIGPNLAKRIQSHISHMTFLSGNFSQSVFIESTTEEEISNITNTFPSGKAAGYDNISMSIIKRSIHVIGQPLTHIINMSITNGIVPKEMKIARVVPLFKSGDKALFSNYRPVSVLPCFSTFLERIMFNRIFAYLDDFGVLSDNQYGFRTKYSTSLALVDMCDKISSAIDRKEHAIGVFLDLSKAFDTVNHHILFEKLEYYGIRGLALDWVKSYFSERSQFVEYNNHKSSFHPITSGVPVMDFKV